MKSQNNKDNRKIKHSVWLEFLLEYILLLSILPYYFMDDLPFKLKNSHFISGRLVRFEKYELVLENKEKGNIEYLSYDFPVELSNNDKIEAYYVVVKDPYYALPGRGVLGYTQSTRIIQLKVNGKLVKKYSWCEEHKSMFWVLGFFLAVSTIHLIILLRIRKKEYEKKREQRRQ